ncbi:MAG TPA: hypothetical protein VN653_08950, partial [Anaerolineales bacterium]|nr:hypothetical protein [Anaerolineales bacterium]
TIRNIFGVFFTVIARLIAVLLAALTIFATILALLFSSLDHTLFQAGTYERILLEQKVYEQLPVLVADQLPTIEGRLANPCIEYPLACAIYSAPPEVQACVTKSLDAAILDDIGNARRKPTPAETQTVQDCIDQFDLAHSTSDSLRVTSRQAGLLRDLTPAQWEVLIQHLLPADDAQKLIETVLEETLAYFKGDVNAVRIALTPLKAGLTGQAGAELVKLLLKSAPPCTLQQAAKINAGDFGGADETPIYCAAEGETLNKLSVNLEERLDKAASELPESAALIRAPSKPDSLPGLSVLGNNPQIMRQRIYTGIRFSPLLVLVLLLLVALFAVRSLRGWMRWWSVPILIGSLITLGIGVASLTFFGWAWGKYVIPAIPPSAGQTLSALGRELAHSLVKDLTLWLVLESGLLAFLALGLLMGSTRVPPPPNRSLPPLAPPGTPGGPVLIQPKSKRKGRRK